MPPEGNPCLRCNPQIQLCIPDVFRPASSMGNGVRGSVTLHTEPFPSALGQGSQPDTHSLKLYSLHMASQTYSSDVKTDSTVAAASEQHSQDEAQANQRPQSGAAPAASDQEIEVDVG